MHRARAGRSVSWTVAVLLIAAGCSGSGRPAAQSAPGVLTIGASEWPQCINPVSQCANSSWENWLVGAEVLPRLAEIDAHGNFVASPLITELPSIANGGITRSPFTVTYHLNPAARWEPDGTPITAADVVFTWHAMSDTRGSLTHFGAIKQISTPDARTVQVVFKTTFADWADVFGGFSGFVLEKSKFPSTDVSGSMADSIAFSGGPWLLESFDHEREVLVANTHYWDAARIPRIREIDFVPTKSSSDAVKMLRSGEVSVLYPLPDAASVHEIQATPTIKHTFGTTTQFENLWFNEKPGHPFADASLRAAFSYAFDRRQFLNAIVKPFDPGSQLLNCAAWIPGHGPWCDNRAFADVHFDPTKVSALMTDDGYVKDAHGVWAKDGDELVIRWTVNTDSARRLATQELFIPELAKLGLRVVAENTDAATMFETRLPAGDYDLAMLVEVSSTDPSVGSMLTGQNDWWYVNPSFDQLSDAADAELDVSRRAGLVHQMDAQLRTDYVTLPLYAFPSLVVWRSDRVVGPVDQDIDSPESVFANMWAWTTTSSSQQHGSHS